MQSPIVWPLPAATFAGRAKLLWLAAAAAVVVYLLWLLWLSPRIFWAPPDFACFYRAGRMVLTGAGSQVYDLAAERQFDAALAPVVLRSGQHANSLPFVFAPFSLLVLAPLSALPYSQAEALWFALNVCAMVALPFLLRRPLRLSDGLVAAALLVPPFFIPVMIAIMHGQTSPLLALLLTLVFLLLARKSYALAGVVLALATWKPQFVLPALTALLAARMWRAIAAFAAASGALLAASILQIGWRPVLVGFPQSILTFTRLPKAMFGENVQNMPNLRGLWTAALGPGRPAVAATIGSSVLLAALLVLVFRRGFCASLKTKFALLLMVTVLVSYHCYGHDATLLVPAALFLAGATVEGSLTWSRVPVGLVIATIFVAGFFSTYGVVMLRTAALMLLLVMLLSAQIALAPSRKTSAAAEGET